MTLSDAGYSMWQLATGHGLSTCVNFKLAGVETHDVTSKWVSCIIK